MFLMPSISVESNIQANVLEEKLKKEANLSEKEAADLAIPILNALKNLENETQKNETKWYLNDLSNSININNKYIIEHNGSWDITIKTENHNTINITINAPQQTPQQAPQQTPQQTPQQVPQQIPQQAPQQISENIPQTELESFEWYNKALTQLLFEIEWCLQTAKYKAWLNKYWKETLKTAKDKLKQYKDIISWKQKNLEHEYNAKNKLNSYNSNLSPLKVNITKAETNELKNKRFRWRQQIEYDIKEWQNWNFSDTAPRPNQNIEQIPLWNYEWGNINNYMLKDANFLRLFENNQNSARNFLQWINNNSLSDQQLYFCQSNMPQLQPYFEQYGLTNQVHRCIQTRWWKYNESMNQYWNIDWKTAYKTWGITGWLTNTLSKGFPNVKPEQASNIANIATAAAWIFAAFKIWKWLFGKDKNWNRNLLGKAAIWAWIFFGPQLLVWKDWFSLLWEILSGKADFSEYRYRLWNSLRFMKNNSPEVYNQMAPGVLWMSIFPQTYTLENVRALQQSFASSNDSRKSRYTSTYNRLNQDNTALANEFKNTFNADHYDENEWNVFLAKIWVNENTKDNCILFKEAIKTTDKKTSLELRMKSQWKEKNKTFSKEIDNYLKENGQFDPNKLNPNWFIDKNDSTFTERPEDIQNKEKLINQVDGLSLDQQTKTELKNEIQAFYDERSIKNKPNLNDFSLELDNNLLVVKSHYWERTKINLQNRTLTWFWSNGANTYEIRFTRIKDLLNVADLTNNILALQRNKTVVSTPPFQYKNRISWGIKWRGIYFNDAEVLGINFDTRVLSWGWWGSIGKIDTLCDHPEEYAQYLSNRWIENLTQTQKAQQVPQQNPQQVQQAPQKTQ